MLKRMSVAICCVAVALLTAGAATAQTATQEAKAKTKSAANKTGTVVSDAEITSAVKTKFLASKTVGGLNIDVDTSNGMVTLNGTVHNASERAEALRIARATKGVKHVTSKLVVGPSKKDEVKADAREKKDEAKADAKEKTAKAKDKADDAAHATKGTAGHAKEAVADATVTAAVKTKLLADPKVGGLKIDVDTVNNVVTLTGRVSSAAERDEAVRLAKNTSGVKSVVSKLTIEPKH